MTLLWYFLDVSQVSYEHITVPRWLPVSEVHPVDYYSTVTKNCSSNFTVEEIRDIRAYYYAMCAETDSMLGMNKLMCSMNML